MANYGRMDIMSMSDEEIERILNEEEKTLEDYEISLLFEELRNRRERAFSPEELPDEEDLIALEESEEEGEDEEGAEGDEEAEGNEEEDEEDEEDNGDEALDGNEEEKEEENGRGPSLKQSQSPDSEKKSSFWPAVLIGGLCVLAIIVLFWFLT